jgi:ASTRA-associated protein 1
MPAASVSSAAAVGGQQTLTIHFRTIAVSALRLHLHTAAMTSPPAPSHLLRAHLAGINTLFFSSDNERLYSADASGTVVVTSTRSLRPLMQWSAHTDAVLGVQEWHSWVITCARPRSFMFGITRSHMILSWLSWLSHGRDNKLHVWTLGTPDADARLGESATAPGISAPTLSYSMDVNALNYCRFSLVPLSYEDTLGPRALIAVPNLVESHLVREPCWALSCVDSRLAFDTLRQTSGSSHHRTASMLL